MAATFDAAAGDVDAGGLGLRTYVDVLRRRRWLVLAVLGAAIAAAGVWTAVEPPVYQAQTTIVIGQGNSLFQVQFGNSIQPFTATMSDLVQSDNLRMEWFRALLADKAHIFQIVVFTCRPGDYLAPGATVRVIDVGASARTVAIAIDDDGVGFPPEATAPWSIASRAAELGGVVRVDPAERPGGHVRIELPEA